MSRAPFVTALLRILPLVLLGASHSLSALENSASTGDRRANAAQEQTFRNAIATTESAYGAYAPALSEQLLSLGITLQAQGRHDEAVDLFKRGVHLARINDGLYSAQQIPLLQGQIKSHIAQGDYSAADERQQYMYRVQVRSIGSGMQRTLALMQQAQWQHNAYRLGLGPHDYTRIMNMWDLYRLALNDIIDREGESSPNLLMPLQGMLEAQYLIAGYQWTDQSHGSSDDLGARQQLNRFNAYRAQSFDKGRSVILAMYGIEQERAGEKSLAAAETLVMLGDWQLWHDEREEAWQAYQSALLELAERDDAQVHIDQLFGEPVALPDIASVSPLPRMVDAEQGNILLEFGVSDRGRVVDLERVDDNDVSNGKANRLMRKLRKTQFRPRFEGGQPTGTDKLVRAFNIE